MKTASRDKERLTRLNINYQILKLIRSEPPETQAGLWKYIRPLPEPMITEKGDI